MSAALKERLVAAVLQRGPANGEKGAGHARPFGPAGKVLVICDVENIWISARKSGFDICFTGLHEHLSRELGATHLHAVCTHDPEGCLPTAELEASPWVLHTREVTWVQRDGEWIRKANADTVFAALTGSLAAQLAPDGLVLLTGDGDLAVDTAEVIRATVPKPPKVIAMGIEGTVSRRLTDRHSSDIGFGGYLAVNDFTTCDGHCCTVRRAG